MRRHSSVVREKYLSSRTSPCGTFLRSWKSSPVGTSNSNSFGLEQVSATNDYLLLNTTLPQAGVLNYRGNQYRTRGLGYQMPWNGRADLPNFPRPPRRSSISARATRR